MVYLRFVWGGKVYFKLCAGRQLVEAVRYNVCCNCGTVGPWMGGQRYLVNGRGMGNLWGLQFCQVKPTDTGATISPVYRVDTTDVDQEPHQSLQLIQQMDTRMPVPLLLNLQRNNCLEGAVVVVEHSSTLCANLSGPFSSCPLPPHLSGPSLSSYATLQVQAQKAIGLSPREDVPENLEDDV
ncbi:hypothetical protein F5141DRAFT_1205230 [Pisolithus sp. B1]|nr:hypothetical protein F5141DRAFT_1205230 [Pisolithus sp. B1]